MRQNLLKYLANLTKKQHNVRKGCERAKMRAMHHAEYGARSIPSVYTSMK